MRALPIRPAARPATIATAAALAALAMLGGCALAPPPKAEDIRAQALPQAKAPAAYTGAPAATLAPGNVADNWLASFGSAQLDALVTEAIAYNTDLALAAVRVEQAAAQARLAGASIYPTLDLLARGGTKSGGDGSGMTGVWLIASWELDLWGRVRAQREAGALAYTATLADVEYARQSIAAAVARAWLLATEARLQRTLATETVRALEQALSLAQDRLRIGRGDEYDVTLVQASLEAARDTERQMALGSEQALRALEILLGRYPAAVVEVAQALPAPPRPLPVGLPSELLERRPDIVAAERKVAAAFYLVSEAKAAKLPRLALNASLSNVSSDLFFLKKGGETVAGIGLGLAAPIFNGYALDAQVEIRTAEQKLAIADYGRVALRAFGEVEGAMSAGFAADERAAILARAVTSNERALELARVRYRVGSGDLRAVLQQNITLYGQRMAELRVASERQVQRVNLHLALGGSFDLRPEADTQGGRIDQAAIRFVSTRPAPTN